MKSKPKLIFDQFPIFRVRRGGSFFNDALFCRSAVRGFASVGYFRLVKPVKKER